MKDKIIHILADQIGVEPEDISMEDSLRDELHMSTVDLAEISDKLASLGFDEVDLSEIDSVEELLEELNVEDDI